MTVTIEPQAEPLAAIPVTPAKPPGYFMGIDEYFEGLYAERGDWDVPSLLLRWNEDFGSLTDPSGQGHLLNRAVAVWARHNHDPKPGISPGAESPDGVSYATRLGARSLAEIPTDPPPPLLIDRLDPEGPTILFGPGNVGKGVYTSYMISRLTALGHHVLVLDYENHPTEWARRVYGFGGNEARAAVTIATPLSAEWGAKRGPLWEQADDIKALCDELDITYLVIDSITPAAMGVDVSTGNTQAPTLYAGALQLIGLPSLSLAHVTRSGDNRYPFGSVMWHNFARFTWSMEEAPDGESKRLKNRKQNNYERQPEQVVTVTWFDGLPRDVLERRHSTVVTELLVEQLAAGDMTANELAGALNTDIEDGAKKYNVDSIRKALNRGLRTTPKLFTKRGDKWGLSADD